MKLLRRAGVFLIAMVVWGREPLPEDRGAAGLWQSLKRLQTTARAMHITAHPDDEDGGMITLLARGRGVEMTLLSLNRGESGANLVTGDFFDALGALRTVELLKSAEYYAAQVRFTRVIDYGFSKNVAETFRNWKREDALRDVVRIIRREKPHVLIARFQGSPRDGHGNHEAAGVLAQEAFEAAGDPQRFPELAAEGLTPWQPLKLYSNNRRENDEWTLRVDAGVYDPVLGRSYAQIARDGLRFQRSQGAGSPVSRPGPSVSYYKLLGSKAGAADKESSFFERLDVSIARYPELAKHVEAAVRAFSLEKPEACAPALAAALDTVRPLRQANPDDALAIKERQIEKALAQALGLDMEALVEPDNAPSGPFAAFRAYETFGVATPGQKFRVAVTTHVRSGASMERGAASLEAPAGWTVQSLGNGRFEVTAAADATPTSAYWRRDSVRESSYRILEPRLFGLPLPPAPLAAVMRYRVHGVEAALTSAVETSYIDGIGVQHRRTLAAGPALSVRFPTEAGVLPLGARGYEVTCVLRNQRAGAARGTLRLALPPGWTSEPPSAGFSFEKEREEARLVFRLMAAERLEAREYPIEAVAMLEGREYRASFQPITYPGLETAYLSAPAVHRVRAVDVKVAAGLRAGYVMGTGDDVPEGLRQLGVPVDLLDATALATGDLGRYSTIVLGIRAYAARSDVKTYNARLLDYAAKGGVVVVQYNTQEYDNNYGPYPYTMTMRAEEVSEEDSPVEILDPDDPVFRFPNAITARDFDGWIEQRGSKFWTTWDPRYKPLLATHDTGQTPQRGGWLVARHGQGLYVYCAYAWYRQLPYAVPGAVRIFANLVSLGAKDAPWRR